MLRICKKLIIKKYGKVNPKDTKESNIRNKTKINE